MGLEPLGALFSKKNNPQSAIMTSRKKNINVKVDWDQLDTFFADQYEEDYGQYFSTTPDTSFSDILIFKSNEMQIA